MLKAFIVDDEPLARDELSYLLKRSKQVEIAGEAECLEAAFENLNNLDIDVVFLDIQLTDESGTAGFCGRRATLLRRQPENFFADS